MYIVDAFRHPEYVHLFKKSEGKIVENLEFMSNPCLRKCLCLTVSKTMGMRIFFILVPAYVPHLFITLDTHNFS